tara:strand:+ start:217 stop:708 length:492 start_codon:yes stop_codon:yes gene_type:complete
MAGSIPSHIKTISIPLMDNQTAEYGIAEDITDNVIDSFNESGILLISDNIDANSILKGTIKKITEGPHIYSKEEAVSEYRFKIDIQVEWYDVLNDKNLIEGIYSGYGAYGLSGDISSDGIDNDNDGKIDDDDDDEFGEPRSFASKVAMQKITEDILNDIMTTW